MIYGIVIFILNPFGQLVYGIGIILTIIFFTYMIYYFSKALLGEACKRCPNFSWAMNKVSKDVVNRFLEKKNLMQKA